MQMRYTFDELHEVGDALLALRLRQRLVVAEPGQVGLDRDDGRADAPLNLLGDELEDGEIQAFLAAEVIADQGLIGAGTARDLARAGGVEAIAGKFNDGGFDERTTRGIAPVTAFWSGSGLVHASNFT